MKRWADTTLWTDGLYSIRQVGSGWFEVYEGNTRRGIFHRSDLPNRALEEAHQKVEQLKHGKKIEELYNEHR